MNRRPWTDVELEVVRKLYPHHPTQEIAAKLNRTALSVYQCSAKLGLKKTRAFLSGPLSGCIHKGDPRQIGAEFRFSKGHTPANKGLRRPGWFSGRMKETQFQKGKRSGKAALNWKPVNTIRSDCEGYLRIKVREAIHGKEATGFGNANVWPLLHHEVWEQFKGPIPPGYVIVFQDGNRANCSIDNLERISHAENMRRNSIWNRLPRELAEVIQLRGALNRKIRRIQKERNGC